MDSREHELLDEIGMAQTTDEPLDVESPKLTGRLRALFALHKAGYVDWSDAACRIHTTPKGDAYLVGAWAVRLQRVTKQHSAGGYLYDAARVFVGKNKAAYETFSEEFTYLATCVERFEEASK